MSATSARSPSLRQPSASRAAVTALAAAVGGSAAAAVVAAIGVALGADGDARQLQPATFVPLAVIGAIAGTVGWFLVLRRATDPRRVLGRLVPTVLAISFIPDLLLGFGGIATWGVVSTLVLMHLAVAAVALPVFARLLPLPARP